MNPPDTSSNASWSTATAAAFVSVTCCGVMADTMTLQRAGWREHACRRPTTPLPVPTTHAKFTQATMLITNTT